MAERITIALHESLTPKELAKLVKVSTGTLANWRFFGKGPAYYRLNGKGSVRYNAASVRKWMRANLITPGESGKRS